MNACASPTDSAAKRSASDKKNVISKDADDSGFSGDGSWQRTKQCRRKGSRYFTSTHERSAYPVGSKTSRLCMKRGMIEDT
ncbi:hypothetical protein FACS1894116_07830 [Betaproteobacteria bacterium]|nr:hypothetical protein FACS1894116_07830 [Betaproteobacteria bacterium]GHT97833.1 hypothetical protein FACS1894154_02090 [Betaproteobacteria bacterium]GHU27172.1 hypothetical protein FACS189488_15240 [Betaproteobacteria bacterium]GHU30165.1 hypothetical protein FACS189497_09490 [Betaproteobacteria bacterium]